MKRTKFLAGTFAALSFILAGAQAQVISIGMKLGGLLCGLCSLGGEASSLCGSEGDT